MEEKWVSLIKRLIEAVQIAAQGGGIRPIPWLAVTQAQANLLQQIHELEERTQWTSFRMGIPNREDWFLFRFANGDKRTGKFDNIFEGGEVAVIVHQRYGGTTSMRFDATHWMPLPDDPEVQ